MINYIKNIMEKNIYNIIFYYINTYQVTLDDIYYFNLFEISD